jgi:hypothetical protein
MTTDLTCEEETLWRNLHAPAASVPFIECVETLGWVTRHAGPVDVRTLQQQVVASVRRHAVLQSRFPRHGGGAQRLTVPERDDPVRVFDLRDLPEHEREHQAARIANAELSEPFDLAGGPLFRVALMILGRAQHVLTFTVHHLVSDGRSAGVVLREMQGHLGSGPNSSSPPSAPYGDYVLWQQRQLAGARLARLRTFWMRKLDGAVDRRLTEARPRIPQSTRSKHVRFAIGSEETDAIRRLTRERRVTVATALLALLAIVIHERTDSTDVVIGLPVSSRPNHEFENTVGLFVNALPVRSDLSRHADFVDLLSGLWAAVLEAYQYRAFPYECLVDALGARTGGGPPPFRVVFNFTQISKPVPVLPGLLTSDMPAAREPPSMADMSLHVRDDGASLDCCVLHKADLFAESQISDIVARVRRLAGEVVRDPSRPIAALVHS